ncbi:hypothetical protein IKF30_00555 [Candidatus Saccharibacteria bacterium]|nr:hypothetical protein [Candidatus Saccharibacteria bacterium]
MNETIGNTGTKETEDNVPGLKFWESNKEEIKEVCRPFVSKFKEKGYDKVLSRLQNYDGVEPASNALYSILSDVLDIDPEMKYESSFEEKPRSSYSTNDNTVYIRTSIKDSNLNKNELALKTFNTISHEMFHAYQYKVANSNEERAELYKQEFYGYKTPETECKYGYASQFLEMEAMFFAYNIEMIISDAIKK